MGLGDFLSEPITNMVGQGLLGLWQSSRASDRKPDLPNFTSPLSGGHVQLNARQEQYAGGSRSMPLSRNSNVADIQRQFATDATNQAQSQSEQNERLLGLSSLIGNRTQTALDQNQGAQRDLANTLRHGNNLFGAARSQIGATRDRVNQIAATSIRSTGAIMNQFAGVAKGLRADMASLRGEAMANAKDNAAIRMAQATDAVTNQTAQAVSDVSASMYAQGLPATAAADTIGKVLASGMKQNGDLQRQISIDENTRLSNLERDWGQMSTSLDAALGTTAGSVAVGGMREIGGALGNLAAQETALTQYNAQLADAESTWRAGVNTTRANMAAQYQNMAMAGQNAMMEIHEFVREPIIALGPIMEGAFTMTTDIENFQYQAALSDAGLDNAIDNMAFAPWFEGANNLLQISEQHHAEGVAHREATQDRNANIGLAVGGVVAAPFTGGASLMLTAGAAANASQKQGNKGGS